MIPIATVVALKLAPFWIGLRCKRCGPIRPEAPRMSGAFLAYRRVDREDWLSVQAFRL
jgi:hypothetical protein